jgi:hypothetical protein
MALQKSNTSPEAAAKNEVKDEAPKPVVTPENPEGVDLAKGDPDASPAFEE